MIRLSTGGFSMKKAWVRLAAAVCLSGAMTVLAQTNAVIPYQTVDRLCEIAAETDQTKLVVRVLITSNNQAVRAADITATIQSASGSIPLEIGEGGRILNFPHTKELGRENPPIIANQPKGTLNLILTGQLAMPDSLSFRYARLGEGVAEANRMIKSQAGWFSLLAPKAQGVGFFFPKASAGQAKIKILSATGPKEFTADEHGLIQFKLEKSLLVENPEVTLSEKPMRVMPDMK